MDWPFSTYRSYMSGNQDESPLYLFDRKFAEKMRIGVGREEGAAYWKPECFGPDLFELLGAERPAHRWLIVGPERSGSTFHKDPNGTSAWNAVLQGAKYWIMFPPTAAVPGVYVSRDSSEVTSPAQASPSGCSNSTARRGACRAASRASAGRARCCTCPAGGGTWW